MQKYVAFLRGLPVGRDTVKMETLVSLFRKLGFLDVETYLATGNVIFNTAPVGLTGPLEAQISRHLRRSLGIDEIWTFIRTPRELADIVAAVPFEKSAIDEKGNTFFIVLLSEEPDEATKKQLRIRRNEVDELHVAGREIYWLRRPHDESVPPPPLSHYLDVHATVRSFHTIAQLAERYAGKRKIAPRKSGADEATESERSRR